MRKIKQSVPIYCILTLLIIFFATSSNSLHRNTVTVDTSTRLFTFTSLQLRCNSLVSTPTSCGLDGPGYGFREGASYCCSKPTRPALLPTQPPIQWVPRFFPVGKAAGA